jgi:hypothetical protein
MKMKYLQLQIKDIDKKITIMETSTIGIHSEDPSKKNSQVPEEIVTPPTTNIP